MANWKSRATRDSRGRFNSGNPGGPGKLQSEWTTLLRGPAIQHLTREDMVLIVERLIALAREGNLAAIRTLFHYTLGQPLEGQHPDEVEIYPEDEADLVRKEEPTQENVPLERTDPTKVCELAPNDEPVSFPDAQPGPSGLITSDLDTANAGVIGHHPGGLPDAVIQKRTTTKSMEPMARKNRAAPSANGWIRSTRTTINDQSTRKSLPKHTPHQASQGRSRTPTAGQTAIRGTKPVHLPWNQPGKNPKNTFSSPSPNGWKRWPPSGTVTPPEKTGSEPISPSTNGRIRFSFEAVDRLTERFIPP